MSEIRANSPPPGSTVVGRQPQAAIRAERLMSLDAYRGMTMLAMASGGLGLGAVARHFPESNWWQTVAFHVEHVPWQGCACGI